MSRKMADPAFRQAQHQHRLDPHISPINEMVHDLRDQDGRGWLPEVAPMHAA